VALLQGEAPLQFKSAVFQFPVAAPLFQVRTAALADGTASKAAMAEASGKDRRAVDRMRSFMAWMAKSEKWMESGLQGEAGDGLRMEFSKSGASDGNASAINVQIDEVFRGIRDLPNPSRRQAASRRLFGHVGTGSKQDFSPHQNEINFNVRWPRSGSIAMHPAAVLSRCPASPAASALTPCMRWHTL
jgi:hypothetical protein